MTKPCKNTKEQAAQGPQKAARDEKGHFLKGVSGNRAGRPQGATCNALRMAREAVENVALPALIEAAKAGDLDACKTLIAYGLPRQRPVTVPEPVALPDGASLADQMRELVRQVARGEVSTTVAGEVADIIATAAKVEEVTELRDHVENLQRVLEQRKENQK